MTYELISDTAPSRTISAANIMAGANDVLQDLNGEKNRSHYRCMCRKEEIGEVLIFLDETNAEKPTFWIVLKGGV